jgi:hypothetical protein
LTLCTLDGHALGQSIIGGFCLILKFTLVVNL